MLEFSQRCGGPFQFISVLNPARAHRTAQISNFESYLIAHYFARLKLQNKIEMQFKYKKVIVFGLKNHRNLSELRFHATLLK